MPPDTLEVFKTSLPQIRAMWIYSLRDEHSLSALGRSETVGFLMDATFLQVLAGLEATGTGIPWLSNLLPVAGPVHGYLACGVAGVKIYYSTGARVIRQVIGGTLGAKIEDLISIFNDIAQREIWLLCTACEHQDCQCCIRFPSTPATPPNEPFS